MTSRYEDLLLPEQRDATIERVIAALKSEGQLSAKTLNNFRRILQAGRPIPGFNKDPIKAPLPALKQHLTERLERNPEFAHLLAEVWTETEPQLKEAVKEHLDGLAPEAYEGDDIDDDFWDAQIDLLAEQNGGYEKDDILLMAKVCYARAKMQAAVEAELNDAGVEDEPSEVVMDTASGVFADVLDRLRMLPAEAQTWQSEVPQFVEALNDLISAKEEERGRLDRLLESIEELHDAFALELGFFGRASEDWNIADLAISADIDEAARILAELTTALQTYQAITERADTLAEERERRERRHELEDDVERMLTDIDALAQNAAASDEDGETGAPDWNGVEAATAQAQAEANSELRDELRALKENYDSLLSSNHALTEENESISEMNRTLEGEVSGLTADRRTLEDEVAELRDQLRISESQELSWRSAYEAEMSSKDSSAPEPIPSEVQSVRQALELAKTRYADKLMLHLNKKSDPDYNYTRPKEVWDALEWLAKTYHPTQTGEARVIDLNESIRNTCGGWEYKPNQTDITFNTYREWYTTTRDGITYELRKHIGKGNGRDNNVIRIAFSWDDESERVIVGYIGPHQRNRVS